MNIPQAPFRSREALQARADYEFRHNLLATLPREFDKGLETAHRLTSGKFAGRYWADRACAYIFEECGAVLVPVLIPGTSCDYRLMWAESAETWLATQNLARDSNFQTVAIDPHPVS